MELGSRECVEALKRYEAKNDIEEKAVELLLSDELIMAQKIGVVDVVGVTGLDGPPLLSLAKAIIRIRRTVGIN